MDERTKAEIAATLTAICAALWWYQSLPQTQPAGTYTTPAPAKEVKDAVKSAVNVGAVRAYPKSAKQSLGLPPSVQQSDDKYVVAADSLKGDYHPRTVVSVLDTRTGEVTNTVRNDPYPWLAAEQRGEVRVDYGVKSGGQRVSRLTVREDLVQIKALHLGATATLDTDREAFIGIGAGYRW